MALVMAPEAGPFEPAQPGSVLSPPCPSLWWFGSYSLVVPFPSPSQYGFYFCGFNKNFTSSSGLGWWGQCSWGLVSTYIYSFPSSGGLSRAGVSCPQPFEYPGSWEEHLGSP